MDALPRRVSALTLQQLQYFRTLAQYENINHAAAVIHISQPALSMSMKKLENELGYSLFDRTGSSIRLNASGKRFLDSVNFIFALIESSKMRAHLPEEGRYELWLGMLTSSAAVTDLCDSYLRENDKVVFRILSRRFLGNAPEMERVDLLFGNKDLKARGYTSRLLFAYRDYAVFPRRFVGRVPEWIGVEDLARMPMILCCPPDVSEPRVLRYFVDAGVSPNIRAIADSRSDVSNMMALGNYLTIAPEFDVELLLRSSDNLIAVPVGNSGSSEMHASGEGLHVSWKESTLSVQGRDFLDYLLSEGRRFSFKTKL